MMRETFINELMQWEGTPFHAHESVKQVGCDCVGLVIGALRELGKPLPMSREDALLARSYKVNFSAGVLGGWMDRNFDRVKDKSRDGDVLVFNIGSRVQHIAVKISAGEIIHAHGYKRRVLVSPYTSGWKARIAGTYSVRGIN